MEYDENAMFIAEEEHGGGIEEKIVEVQWRHLNIMDI